mmetsp:Transcript_64536/g.135449  ORF Transcript_64536/g.135449 Transcript_64536/m.135449 type:complete len:263 (-) Transcript_64536:337-1125(-)
MDETLMDEEEARQGGFSCSSCSGSGEGVPLTLESTNDDDLVEAAASTTVLFSRRGVLGGLFLIAAMMVSSALLVSSDRGVPAIASSTQLESTNLYLITCHDNVQCDCSWAMLPGSCSGSSLHGERCYDCCCLEQQAEWSRSNSNPSYSDPYSGAQYHEGGCMTSKPRQHGFSAVFWWWVFGFALLNLVITGIVIMLRYNAWFWYVLITFLVVTLLLTLPAVWLRFNDFIWLYGIGWILTLLLTALTVLSLRNSKEESKSTIF